MADNKVPLAYCAGLVPLKTHYYNKEPVVMAGKVIAQGIIDQHKNIAETFIISLRHSQDISATVQRNKEAAKADKKNVKLENMAQVYEEDTVIFEEGDTSNELYVLLEGEIEVSVQGNVVATIKDSGTYFGEMALLRGEPRSAKLRTVTPAKFYVISGEVFPSIIKANPDVSAKISQILADRLATANENIQGLKDKLAEKDGELESVKGELEEAKNAPPPEPAEPAEVAPAPPPPAAPATGEIPQSVKDDLKKYKEAALKLFHKSAGEYNSVFALLRTLATQAKDPDTKKTLVGVLEYMKTTSNMTQKGKPTPIKADKINAHLKSLLK